MFRLACLHLLGVCNSLCVQYSTAFYWAAATMTTTGYGDRHAEADIERCVSIAIMVIGRMLFAYVLGKWMALMVSDGVWRGLMGSDGV